MSDRELKKMSRMELIDILCRLRLENAELEEKLEEANSRLNDRIIVLNNAGSIADAAIGLNNIFESAQKAADQYIDSVKNLCEKRENQIQMTKQQYDRIISEAISEAERIKADAENEKKKILEAADKECKLRYDRFVVKAYEFIKKNPELKAMFTDEKGRKDV